MVCRIIFYFVLILPLLVTSLNVLVLGGTGRIGSAVASHLLLLSQTAANEPLHIVLSGRDIKRGEAAVQEVLAENRGCSGSSVEFRQLDWRDDKKLRQELQGISAVIHTAGPYAGEEPVVLKAALDLSVPVYVDLSDPVEYLDRAKSIGSDVTENKETLALCAAGAFPGMSNVLAMECVARLGEDTSVKDIDFSYFTAGLGGSGDVNLYITNDGFGEEVPVYRDGVPYPTMDAGCRERTAGAPTRVKFFLDEKLDPSATLVGERAVWSWPFPEGTLIPRQLETQRRGISGRSSVGMGTAPAIWNDVMGIMVDVVPRKWWKSRAFSIGLARFSKPLVALTDLFVGETHAMRIDVTGEDGRRVSAVQAHESFRLVVGQSCAEFTRAMLESKGLFGPPRSSGKDIVENANFVRIPLPSRGVFTPEELFAQADVRKPMLDRLLTVPGTLNAGFEEEMTEVQLPSSP